MSGAVACAGDPLLVVDEGFPGRRNVADRRPCTGGDKLDPACRVRRDETSRGVPSHRLRRERGSPGAAGGRRERAVPLDADPEPLQGAVRAWHGRADWSDWNFDLRPWDERARDVDNEATRLLRRLRERGSRALPTAGSDNRPETLYPYPLVSHPATRRASGLSGGVFPTPPA
jgi:hypothetical protein